MTSNKQVKPRKPRLAPDRRHPYYAGVEIRELENLIYIGGHSYDYPTQIHITDLKAAKRIHKFLGSAILYLEHQEKKGE